METNEKQISRNIKSCRQKVGLYQQDVAKIMNITKQTYINIENKPMNYSMNKLIAVSKAIGCNIDDFFIK